MFVTKNLACDITQVPATWVFEHYCKLDVRLVGQDIKIKSLFNQEKTPSMCIYFSKKFNSYRFKDFSSGYGGSAIDLVKSLHGDTYHNACVTIIEEYNKFISTNGGDYSVSEIKQHSKYRVDKYILRSWDERDAIYWTNYNINSALLGKYNVRPIEEYSMKKIDGDSEISITIKSLYLYGYFTSDGELYKIYQPKTLDKKFIKVKSYIQGSEQLENKKWLVITSSLKDILAIKSLSLNIDVIAPDSENSLLDPEYMKVMFNKYGKVIVMFDNDEAGIKAMKRYKELYPEVELLLLPMSKDVSDSIKDYGALEVKNRLVPLLNRKINEKC